MREATRVLAGAIAVLTSSGCAGKTALTPGAPTADAGAPSPAATSPVAPDAPDASVPASDAAAPASASTDASSASADAGASSRALRFVKHLDGRGGSSCDVVDAATGDVVFHATSKNTAVGGSTVECLDFVAKGRVIRFTNSRGIYAKDARPGASNDRALPCGEGVFADDVTSCVRLDASPFALGASEQSEPAVPFDVKLCVVRSDADHDTCKTLLRIPRGLNRLGPPGRPGPERWWDAVYCSDDRVLVAGEGALRLFEAPSGKLLATAKAPGAQRIVRCEGGVAETTGSVKASFRVGPSRIDPSPSPAYEGAR